MDTTSLWKTISTRSSSYPELSKDIEVDVAIIGGGITGITAALHLIKAGKKVAILEADKMGGVTTGYSTGNLYIAVQPFYQNIYSKFDFETAKSIAYSRKFAIDYIEKNVHEKIYVVIFLVDLGMDIPLIMKEYRLAKKSSYFKKWKYPSSMSMNCH